MTQTLSKTPINTPRVTPIINPTPILLSSTTPNNPTGTSFNNTSSNSHSNPGNMCNNPQPQNIGKYLWTMSEMVIYRAALRSFQKYTALVFYHL